MQQAHGATGMEQITSTPLVVHEFADFPSAGSNLLEQKQKNNLFSPHLIAMVFKVRWD